MGLPSGITALLVLGCVLVALGIFIHIWMDTSSAAGVGRAHGLGVFVVASIYWARDAERRPWARR